MNQPKGPNSVDLEAEVLLAEFLFDAAGLLVSGAVEVVDSLLPRLAGRSQ
jgi:hypothetical protein